MSQQNETGVRSIVAGAARAIYTRVYNSSGTWTTADASHAGLGVQQVASLASTDVVPLRLCTAPGTTKMTAAGVIAIGGTCYAAAAGKVASTGTIIEGVAMEAAGADGDIIEVMPIHNTDVSTASTGTTAGTWQVDSDLGKPRAGLKSQTGGTGDFVAYYQAPATLTANRTYTGPADADDTLVGAAATQTLTNKTMTSPVLTTPKIDDGDAGISVTSADQTHGSATATIPDIGDAADEFVMKDTTQTLTGKTLTSAVLGATPRFGHTVTPVAAAGSSVSDAAALADTMITHITSDSAAKGVKLPAVTTYGVVRIVVNNSSTAAEIYAESTGTINGASADASMVIPASKGVLCISTAAKTWIAFDLPALATAS